MAKKLMLILAGGLLILGLAWALWPETIPVTPEPPWPNPNGYDDFLKAAALIRLSPSGLPLEGTNQDAAANARALALERAGLAKECRFPATPALDPTNDITPFFVETRQLCLLFLAEAKVVNRTNPAAALRICFEGVRFGQEARRGAVMSYAGLGIALEQGALQEARGIAGGLTAGESRQAAVEFRVIMKKSPTFEETLERERAWSRRLLAESRAGFFSRILLSHMVESMCEKAKTGSFEKCAATERALLADLQRNAATARGAAPRVPGDPPRKTSESLGP